MGEANLVKLDFVNTEASTLEIVETGLGDDLLSEQLWENDEVSYWGSDVDSDARNNCNYTWSGLRETVPRALDSVDLITIRRFVRKTWRYMDLYRHGITGKLAEYATKKFRRIPEDAWDELRTN